LILAALLLTGLVTFLHSPRVAAEIFADLRAIRERDPAAEGWIAAFFYPGWWALLLHRLAAHPLYEFGLKTPARLFNFLVRFMTGTDIHPGAQFGRGIFIDHAHGVVVGETAIVGDNVTILHQVTLGGTGKETGKRHPTIEDGVLLGAGCKILGNIIIGRDSKIGAGSVVVHAVPPESTVVGVPGRVVASGGQRLPSKIMDQTALPDPLVEKILEVQEEVRRMSLRLAGMQAQAAAGGNVLSEITVNKYEEVAALKAALPLDDLRGRRSRRGEPRSFYKALRRPGLQLIAEIKKASPSGGMLRPDFDPPALARSYEEAGAAALSVLTDEKYFQGSLAHLEAVREASRLPILRKDFIVDEYQIVEAERHGADAVLLIAACLSHSQLRDFREAAEGEGLDALVEVHDEVELEAALKSGARIIGINNRDLKTLKTNIETTFALAQKIPREIRNGVVLVSESGLQTAEAIGLLKAKGINAVLIGETFMRAPDPAAKVRELMGV